MSADDDEVEVTGAAGFDALRAAPHARFDCLEKPFNKDRPTIAEARPICTFCYCWVCDVPARECAKWSEHCMCNGSPEWVQEKNKAKRERERAAQAAAQQAAGAAPPSAEEVADRFRQAAAGSAAPPSAQVERRSVGSRIISPAIAAPSIIRVICAGGGGARGARAAGGERGGGGALR